ncbi:prolyl-tRNA synthetase [Desulfosalsimonas propionicica]|uniref:Proline--tRNA ligase n=1 Tax=Desulfosalsimonas propionicica TaxID=332175 RepID=A0A7W0C6Z5_9BACT|nr:proline--tRNA ligase [Desulfosalsimonas propionicica]MBA2880298.1 prolyl-tRNA synthetase [Desulfosalsimonas propionicica]
MTQKNDTAIRPTRAENYPEWYQQVIRASDMAELSPVRGCMVIKPWGYALWENMVRALDDMFKATGVRNAYFPLFIPISFLEKEAEHVEGFAKECAVVTHHKLEKDENNRLVPAGKLNEPLIVRPTSETIIGDAFARWIKSYRDLPMLLNQWANVVRWEMRTRIFLRTSEFLWQEGHTVHATKQEAIDRTYMMLNVYKRMAEEYLAIPVITGEKSVAEKFPGAEITTCIEAMMQDKKALQAGTSHFLGQNFARASGIRFQSAMETEEYGWTTSWGVSTRMIGGLIMTHSDDNGIVLPPRVASAHVVLLPILKKKETNDSVMAYTQAIAGRLRQQNYHGTPLRVEIDDRNIGGTRNWDWIKKGVPLRVEIGPKDMDADSVFVSRRDRERKDRFSIQKDEFIGKITEILDEIQSGLYEKALCFLKENTRDIDDPDEFNAFFSPKNPEEPEIHGGFARSHWCGRAECEKAVKERLNVTIRCIPFDRKEQSGACIQCGEESQGRVVFAKAY